MVERFEPTSTLSKKCPHVPIPIHPTPANPKLQGNSEQSGRKPSVFFATESPRKRGLVKPFVAMLSLVGKK